MSTTSRVNPTAAATPSPRRARVRPLRADVREGVLAAGRDAFRELGYHGASLDGIARRAGFSKGAVYSNFDSKESLFLACMDVEMKELGDKRRETTSTTDTDAYFRDLATWLLGIASDGRGQRAFTEFAAYAARDAELSARLVEVRRPLTERTMHTLAAVAQEQGRDLAVSAADAAAMVLSLANGLSLEQIGREEPVMTVDGLATLLRALYV
ncbi:TetR/AcrR family transcriptional regulator [Nocardioidaceae bacterium]|nr:TetR/AcrR family transcriptional regulator [Nocardioidaceae bacterium]